ncbi:hypothetical protein ACLOJK_031875 [Asimina triloba]
MAHLLPQESTSPLTDGKADKEVEEETNTKQEQLQHKVIASVKLVLRGSSAVIRDLPARITRARAAAIHSMGGLPPLKPSVKQAQKQLQHGNSKRAALGGNTDTASVAVPAQNKKRAVLKDVTNVCCDNSYGNCINAAKVQAKGSKNPKLCNNKKDAKVALVINVETASSQVGKLDEPQKLGGVGSDAAKLSAKLGQNLLTEDHTQFISEERRTAFCDAGTPVTENLVLRKPSVLKLSSKTGNEVEGKLLDKLGSSKDLEIIDIDADHKSPQLCGLYAPDIYRNLHVAELTRRPQSNFMETLQKDITQSMRGILVDWLVEVSEEYKLVSDTLYLTVYFIDRFLSQNYIERQRLQLLGVTCMLIASKYEEICAPRVEEFCLITDNTYRKEEEIPTSSTILFEGMVPMLALEFLACYLAELTLVEYEFLKFLPSRIAASAVFLARWTLDQNGHPWTLTLEHYTHYKASDLKETVLALQDLQLNSKCCPLNAIREKYRQQKANFLEIDFTPAKFAGQASIYSVRDSNELKTFIDGYGLILGNFWVKVRLTRFAAQKSPLPPVTHLQLHE